MSTKSVSFFWGINYKHQPGEPYHFYMYLYVICIDALDSFVWVGQARATDLNGGPVA